MKILVIGAGGREHALIWKIKQDTTVKEIFCVPGNYYINKITKTVNIDPYNNINILKWVHSEKIDLTIVGPETNLCNGIVDHFNVSGLPILGPTKNAALIEGSKSFSKKIMLEAEIPTALSEEFTDYKKSVTYIENLKEFPIVIKADGLASGKGVFICHNAIESKKCLYNLMVNKIHGNSGNKVLIEEYLQGHEISIIAIVDENNIVLLNPAHDYKKLLNDDKGPNTGGMGSISSYKLLSDDQKTFIHDKIFYKLIKKLKEKNIIYKGILYAGLMITDEGIKVLEFNCRFGDPETQALLPLWEGNIISTMMNCINNNLKNEKLNWKNESSICVTISSKEYPNNSNILNYINYNIPPDDIIIFGAGNTGRLLNIVSTGKNLKEANKKVYNYIDKLNLKNYHFRTDIGNDFLNKL